MIWTEALSAALVVQHATGQSFKIISEKLSADFGLSIGRSACIWRARRMKLPERAATIQDAAAMGKVARSQNAKVRRSTAAKINRIRKAREKAARPAAPVKAVVVPEPVYESPVCPPVSLMDAGNHDCRAIIGDVDGPYTMFCGSPQKAASSYCPYHGRLMWTKHLPRVGRRHQKPTLVPRLERVA